MMFERKRSGGWDDRWFVWRFRFRGARAVALETLTEVDLETNFTPNIKRK